MNNVPTLISKHDVGDPSYWVKFQALVTSITGKEIDVFGKKPCFEIINGVNKW